MPENITVKLVILDRDGVINEDSDEYIKSVDEWIPVKGSIAAIARLCKAGYRIAIATNQSGLARGLFTEQDLLQIHNKLIHLVEEAGGQIDVICYCPHHPDDLCPCRKPLPGLLSQIEASLSVSVKNCYLVGDSLKDIQLAASKSCIPILVRSGKGQETEQALNEQQKSGLLIFDNLFDASSYILSH